MTPVEFVERMECKLTLRYFGGDPNVPDPSKQWRAALAGHYYTSDSGRSIDGPQWDDGRDGEGWGTTPDEAVSDLASILIDSVERRGAGCRESALAYEDQAAEMRRKLQPGRSR